MPVSNKDIKNAIEKAFENITDAETLKSIGAINSLIEEKEKQDNKLMADHVELVSAYKQAVMGATLPSKGNADETGGALKKNVSLEEIINQITKGK